MDEALAAVQRFVAAVAAADGDAIAALLTPDVRLRSLLPEGPGGSEGVAAAVAAFLGWFGDARELEIQRREVEPIADRMSARYRFVLDVGRGREVIEQQLYLDVDAGRIAVIDLLCSGFRPDERAPASNGVHRFDAGTMGCADGLAQEFRRRIGAIAVGDLLEVTARDPAAKEDLPSLARMMGHAVRSVEAPGDGRLLITVERTR